MLVHLHQPREEYGERHILSSTLPELLKLIN
jgi:hypothetical protein